MFKRKIEKDLQEWKEGLKIKKKALLIKGLRQIGKTTIINEFAKRNFDNIIYIDFKKRADLKSCFDEDLSINNLITSLSAKMPNAIFIPNKTVIIFDEIQECSGARASIKYFVEDGRFDIISSGSLLGIKGYNKSYHGGVPVGYEHTIMMKPMDFEEFLWAIGINEIVIEAIKKSFKNLSKIDDSINDSLFKYLREYICVGGLPEVVSKFILTRDLNQVRKLQLDIIEGYKDDFAKHLDENENEKTDIYLLGQINKVFDSIPSQLGKENKKFMVSKIDSQSSLDKYGSAIQWLIDYGLICKCFNLSIPEFPLEGNKIDNVFKIYFSDIGLLIASLEDGTAGHIISGDLGIYKGAVYENFVADTFCKNSKKLYYFSKLSGLEIDFIMNDFEATILLEVKAKDGRTKSSKEVLTNKAKYPNVSKLIRLKQSNVGIDDNIITLPIYMAFLL